MLGMTALAADEPAEGVVLRVSALKKDDTTVVNTDKTNAGVSHGEGSLVGNGSISMILSLFTVFVACAALGVVVTKSKKKRAIP